MPFSSNGVPGGLAEGPLISSMGSEVSSVGLEVSSVGLGNMCSGTGSMVISWRRGIFSGNAIGGKFYLGILCGMQLNHISMWVDDKEPVTNAADGANANYIQQTACLRSHMDGALSSH